LKGRARGREAHGNVREGSWSSGAVAPGADRGAAAQLQTHLLTHASKEIEPTGPIRGHLEHLPATMTSKWVLVPAKVLTAIRPTTVFASGPDAPVVSTVMSSGRTSWPTCNVSASRLLMPVRKAAAFSETKRECTS
jgi:hypothetical protein